LILVFRHLIGDALISADLFERLEQRFPGHARIREQYSRVRLAGK